MQQFPHVPDRLRNSRIVPTLPNTVLVSREVFDKLHDLEAKASNLRYDCLHPAFRQYRNVADEANTAFRRFRENRASFIVHPDISDLDSAERSINDAAEKVDSLLVRYRFLERLVKEWRGRPPIGKTFKGEAADQKWVHGIVPTDDVGDAQEVRIDDGIVASQYKLEGTIRFGDFLSGSRGFLRFDNPTSAATDPSHDDLLATILEQPPFYIVGWTLSIRTEQPGAKSFSVKSGGILESDLEIEMKAPIFRRADWCCRIYSVNSVSYNFPHLTSKGRWEIEEY